MEEEGEKSRLSKRNESIVKAAFAFLVLMSVMSLFNDMTFEGANSALGAFESYLGAPTVAIAAIGGIGTLLGCSLRLLSGFLADKTKKYWLFTILGYCIDVLSVPLLALVPEGWWQLAIFFVLTEKIGKAIKKPAKSSLVSFAAKQTGEGKSFAFAEALDQIGACLGPMILTLVYTIGSSLTTYQKYVIGFAALGVPALICIALLLIARHKFPTPENFEPKSQDKSRSIWTSKAYLVFVAAGFFFAAGYLDSFSLIDKHLADLALINADYLPLLYSYAMFIDALSAVAFGFLFDKIGFLSVGIASLLSAPYAFFFFASKANLTTVFLGLTSWGIGMGAIESILQAGVAKLSPKEQRARAFGFFELFYGLSSFAFSFLIAYLYDHNRELLCYLSLLFVGIGTILFFLCQPLYLKERKKAEA